MLTSQRPTKKGNIPSGGLLPGIVQLIVLDSESNPTGQVKVWLPHIHGDPVPDPGDLPSAVVASPWGGTANTGITNLPPVGSSVLVGFLLGDIAYPVVLGNYYGQEGVPDQARGGTPENKLTLQNPDGWVVQMDFTESKFKIESPDKSSLVMDDSGVTIGYKKDKTIKWDADGITISDSTGNAIKLLSSGTEISLKGVPGDARVIHEFGICPITGTPLGIATGGASGALRVPQVQ